MPYIQTQRDSRNVVLPLCLLSRTTKPRDMFRDAKQLIVRSIIACLQFILEAFLQEASMQTAFKQFLRTLPKESTLVFRVSSNYRYSFEQ